MRQIFFVRHGMTEYREEGFDLTPDGVEQIKDAAGEIAMCYASTYKPKGLFEINIFSSPAARAKASAEIIHSEFRSRNLPVAPIIDEPELRSFESRDREALLQKMLPWWNSPWDDYYWINPIFEQAEVVEPRTEVVRRSLRFLGNELVIESSPFSVMVTHFEIITPWLPLFGFERALGPGEWVRLVMRSGEVSAIFRHIMRTRQLSELLKELLGE